jgi:hypothetical protein
MGDFIFGFVSGVAATFLASALFLGYCLWRAGNEDLEEQRRAASDDRAAVREAEAILRGRGEVVP